jgi:hypothetical protein
MAAEIDSPLLRAIRRAFSQPTTAQLRLVTKPAGAVPTRVWIVWRQLPFSSTRTIELVTADEQRAIRLAASQVWLRAEALDVEDAGSCPGWCPNRDVPT